jgi:AbiTii
MSGTRNIIKSIQADIIDPKANLYSILLKTNVLADRLKNEDLKRWAGSEIEGYCQKLDVPDYRIIQEVLFRRSNIYNSQIAILGEPQELSGSIYIYQGIITLEEMAKQQLIPPIFSSEWLKLNYPRHYGITARTSPAQHMVVEACKPILRASILQIVGIVRSRLQDFILEIDSLDWDVSAENIPFDQVNRIFNVTINHQVGVISNMLSIEGNGDNYNIGQAGAVGKYARSDGNTFIQSEQKQSLSEVAEEIQQLLKQLEQIHPAATDEEKMTYVSDETTPNFKRRAVAAFLAGSETAIDEFILENKSVKVVKSAIKAWLEPH